MGVVTISAATPLISPASFERWFASPYAVPLTPLPLATLLLYYIVERSLRRLPTRSPVRAKRPALGVWREREPCAWYASAGEGLRARRSLPLLSNRCTNLQRVRTR